ncbi:hypothetical protein [Endozoicomonas numazuensis]|uniref:Uncharacterized protein n=1 Tax=Endozoicomonas numazuensis TaxID=1137799 RepID=A0A081NFR0_9GAMM|nr:hypothetical protein [Endozoicomonas numazuensis]KEQ17283.1 hypothetical protein GZ78_15805 [Endozoicomonas numazuensis]
MLSKPHVCQKLGLKHALSDASAGYIAGCWFLSLPIETLIPLLIAYNLVAFGCQPLFSLLPEKFENKAISIALLLAVAALLLAPERYWMCLICIATGSALFHVNAGSIGLKSSDNDSFQLSWFIAPGVLGLLTGMAAGINELSIVSWGLIAGLSCSMFINTSTVKPAKTNPTTEPFSISFALIAIFLLLISMRSLVWSFYQGNLTLSASLLLIMATAAFFGKLAEANAHHSVLYSAVHRNHWLNTSSGYRSCMPPIRHPSHAENAQSAPSETCSECSPWFGSGYSAGWRHSFRVNEFQPTSPLNGSG